MHRFGTTLLVVTAVVLAGCTGAAPTADSPRTESVETPERTTTEATSTTPTTTVVAWPPSPYEQRSGPRSYPEPPSNLSDEAVERTVDRYESAYVFNTLAGAEGVENPQVPHRATTEILRQAHGGVIVQVTLRYSFERTTESNVTSIYDGRVKSIYFVNTTTVWRIESVEPITY